jgi:hypothetical protein
MTRRKKNTNKAEKRDQIVVFNVQPQLQIESEDHVSQAAMGDKILKVMGIKTSTVAVDEFLYPYPQNLIEPFMNWNL